MQLSLHLLELILIFNRLGLVSVAFMDALRSVTLRILETQLPTCMIFILLFDSPHLVWPS